jgi:hypothetical protein
VSTYLHQHLYAVALLGSTVLAIILIIVIWSLWHNHDARERRMTTVIGLIKALDPACRVQRKRFSTKHVCFYLMGIDLEFYFDSGRRRFELYDARERKIIDQRTIGQGIELDPASLNNWLKDFV